MLFCHMTKNLKLKQNLDIHMGVKLHCNSWNFVGNVNKWTQEKDIPCQIFLMNDQK